jgi:hypothetical protein
MKKAPTLLITVILSSTVGIIPVLAKDTIPAASMTMIPPSAPTISADKQEYDGMLKESYTMMGYVGVANIALLYNLTDEATDNVQKALTIARKLEGQTAKLNADYIKVGKIKYHSANGDTQDYWLPVVDDTFVVDNLDAEYLKSKQPKAEEEDAQTVTTKVELDTKEIRDSLEKAAAAITARNYGDAEGFLITAEQSTFTDQTATTLPLVTARDNLALGKAFVKSKDYDGASFALNHAKNTLEEYRKTADKDNAVQAEKLQTAISDLQTEIAKDRLSLGADIEKSISSWIDDIKGLI